MLTKKPMYAYETGYRVIDDRVVNFKTGNERKISATGGEYSYPKFSFKYKGIHMTCKVHQLVAWQKYGKECIGSEVVVRHLDDNKWNFRIDNIELGTREDNERDRAKNRSNVNVESQKEEN